MLHAVLFWVVVYQSNLTIIGQRKVRECNFYIEPFHFQTKVVFCYLFLDAGELREPVVSQIICVYTAGDMTE